ncbi:MAG: hypothetical protein NTU98_06255 [Bacteroidetes bacterium]|nr:hypothetical protein [Bacteroidota bacterium]
MKTRHLVIGLVILIVALSACREITVRTTVNSDGSFTRIITVSGDSGDAFKQELPYPVDASWTMTSKKDTAGKDKFIVTYTKNFKDCEELKAGIGRDTSWLRQLVRSIDIRKRFGFFYSYVEYKEVYPAANPFTTLSYKDHVTKEEFLWLTRKHPVQSPSDSIKRKDAEDKVMAYLVESATAEAEKILAEGIRKLNDPNLDEKKAGEFHDRISAALSKWNYKDAGVLIDSLRIWTGNSAAERLKEIQPPLFQEFNRKAKFLENLLPMEEFHAEAELPGLITGTNSSVLNGNRVSWDVFPMAFLLEDYTMVAESRVINVWAFVLSGLIVLGLLILLIVKSLKR